ncbi:MAG: L-histidine N(alpha)-methyltransferase [Planctomycetota bacterium]
MTAVKYVTHFADAQQTYPPNAVVTMSDFLDDVVQGLSQTPKQLQCKYFYDEKGSALFDQICELDEYYLTRTERQILSDHIDEMARQLGEQILLVEFGSGSSLKTRLLLDALIDPVGYVPLDISEEHLLKTANHLRSSYPQIEIIPVIADFTQNFQLPDTSRPYSHAAVFFPGSTIGNFLPDAATDMLSSIAGILGPQGGLLIGIDLQKDAAIINAAYNDSKQITDQFNLNVLHRVNRELDANFEVSQFRHHAVYNSQLGRVEISVVSLCNQTVTIGPHQFEFESGDMILTEYSHKYTIEGFEQLAKAAGFSLRKSWVDDQNLFAVLHLVHDRASK